MAETTGIAWTDSTFNPWIGCTKISPGCANCYAETLDHRFGGGHWGKGAPRKRTSAANWKLPLRWNKSPRADWERPRVFCGSLCDVFDPEVPASWLADLAALIAQTPNLDWLLLTKRPESFWRWKCATVQQGASHPIRWPSNVWLGVTVENQEQAEKRIPLLLEQSAAVRFLSCEPMLGPVDLRSYFSNGGDVWPSHVDWVIVGGESGPRARPCDLAWVRSLRDQCKEAVVPCFVKQMGANCYGQPEDADSHEEAAGYQSERNWFKDRAGADPDEWPEDLRVQQWPEVSR